MAGSSRISSQTVWKNLPLRFGEIHPQKARGEETKVLVAAAGVSQLAGNGGEDRLDPCTQVNENRNRHHRDERQNKSVLNQGLAFLAFVL